MLSDFTAICSANANYSYEFIKYECIAATKLHQQRKIVFYLFSLLCVSDGTNGTYTERRGAQRRQMS